MKKLVLTLGLLVAIVAAIYAQQNAIRIVKEGKGSPIIFLPGFTTPGSVWKETVHNLKGNYQSHLVSYAGFNGIAPIKMPWYETIKKETLQYIANEKLTDIIIIGHSMGGTLAIDIAAEIPGTVKKIVLVDALPCMRDLMMPGVSANQLSYDSPYNQQMMKQSAESFAHNAKMMAQFMTMTKEKIDTLVNWSVAADKETFVYGYTDLLKLDLREACANVKAKTLILGASFPDEKVVTGTFEKQYAKLSNWTLAIAPGSKHFIMFDQPQWFYDQVNSFLTN
jgi:pimeloyl-ACP methyl ester carboxylesterase